MKPSATVAAARRLGQQRPIVNVSIFLQREDTPRGGSACSRKSCTRLGESLLRWPWLVEPFVLDDPSLCVACGFEAQHGLSRAIRTDYRDVESGLIWTRDYGVCRHFPIMHTASLAVKWWANTLVDESGGKSRAFRQAVPSLHHVGFPCSEPMMARRFERSNGR